jgi:hypothetical protein
LGGGRSYPSVLATQTPPQPARLSRHYWAVSMPRHMPPRYYVIGGGAGAAIALVAAVALVAHRVKMRRRRRRAATKAAAAAAAAEGAALSVQRDAVKRATKQHRKLRNPGVASAGGGGGNAVAAAAAASPLQREALPHVASAAPNKVPVPMLQKACRSTSVSSACTSPGAGAAALEMRRGRRSNRPALALRGAAAWAFHCAQ